MNTGKVMLACAVAFSAAVLAAMPPVPPATQPGVDNAEKMPMTHMENLAKIKALLEDAKKQAGANNAVTAKLDEALKVMEQDHQMIHQCMSEMQETMRKRLTDMAAMQRDMTDMKEKMGSTEATKPMRTKMEEMRQKMEQMQEEMRREGADTQMKCPMCGMGMMGAAVARRSEKVSNFYCPITGNRIDPNYVPPSQIREFEGRRIGFCSPGCPLTWDQLTDEQKREKLASATAKSRA